MMCKIDLDITRRKKLSDKRFIDFIRRLIIGKKCSQEVWWVHQSHESCSCRANISWILTSDITSWGESENNVRRAQKLSRLAVLRDSDTNRGGRSPQHLCVIATVKASRALMCIMIVVILIKVGKARIKHKDLLFACRMFEQQQYPMLMGQIVVEWLQPTQPHRRSHHLMSLSR